MVSRSACLACCVACSVLHQLESSLAPARPLNCIVEQFSVGAAASGMPADGIFGFDIFAPYRSESCNSSTFPVIFFATGFGANVPASIYSDLLMRVVQQGFIVVGMHRTGYPAYKMEGQKFVEVLEWAKAGHLGELLVQHRLSAVPDVLERAAVMAQSAGNHVIGEAMQMNCSIAKAAVMIDPVDGADPYGIDRSQDLIVPGKMLNFTIPALLIDNGLDPKSLNILYPPCAPPALSNDRFYNAWSGPIWNVNATAYGHLDCLNDGDATRVSHLVCPSDPKTDKAAYRSMLANSAVSFLLALFEDQPDRLKLFEDATNFSVDVVLKQDLKGMAYEQIKAGCRNSKSKEKPVEFEFFA